MSIQLPERIKIGPYYFEINERAESWQRATDAHGSMIFEDLQINAVTEGRSDIFILDTVTHEINHGIWSVYHLEEDDSEERIVSTLATGFIAVLRDNPEFMAYIQEVLKQA